MKNGAKKAAKAAMRKAQAPGLAAAQQPMPVLAQAKALPKQKAQQRKSDELLKMESDAKSKFHAWVRQHAAIDFHRSSNGRFAAEKQPAREDI